jgi:hypothetical protein
VKAPANDGSRVRSISNGPAKDIYYADGPLPWPRQKKRRGVAAAFKVAKSNTDYLETDFLNMRSIFSLIASMAVEFACAVDRA